LLFVQHVYLKVASSFGSFVVAAHFNATTAGLWWLFYMCSNARFHRTNRLSANHQLAAYAAFSLILVDLMLTRFLKQD
jgi:hypothetical protein